MGDTVVFQESDMGGNALARFGLSTHRLAAPEFHRLSAALEKAFVARFPGVRIQAIPAYREKPDFGDLDLLVAREPFVANGGVEALEEWCQSVGHSRGQDRNGPVTSVEWRSSPNQEQGFQVDFITVPEAEFDLALNYFSYNDLGNLVGRIAHKMGLLHGHQGLMMPIRDDTHEFARIQVCSDSDRVLSFLGYDPARFAQGFSNLNEIFEFVASSPYFNKDIFLLENRNHASRTRDRKRKTYREFLEWIADREGLPSFAFPEDKKEWLPIIFKEFPECQAEYEAAWKRLHRHRWLNERFNGEKVAEITGLSGKDLGRVMSSIRANLSSQEIASIIEHEGLEGMRPAIDRAVADLKPLGPRGP